MLPKGSDTTSQTVSLVFSLFVDCCWCLSETFLVFSVYWCYVVIKTEGGKVPLAYTHEESALSQADNKSNSVHF